MTFTMIEPLTFFSLKHAKIQLQSKKSQHKTIFFSLQKQLLLILEIFPNLYRFIFVSKKICLKNYGRTSLTHTHTYYHTTSTYRNTLTSLETKKKLLPSYYTHTQIKLNRFKMNITHCCKN
jgi:hypothetical protein